MNITLNFAAEETGEGMGRAVSLSHPYFDYSVSFLVVVSVFLFVNYQASLLYCNFQIVVIALMS